MGRYPGDKGGRPPLPPELRKPRKKASPTALTLIQEQNAALQGRTEDNTFASPYTKEQKAQAVAAYSVTNSAPQAVRILEGLWGLGCQVPAADTIREWAQEGVQADETALDAITRWHEARRKVLAFEVFERTQQALVGRPLDKEKLFNVVGAYKIAGDTVAQAFQRQQGGGTTLDMRGATFIRSGDKPIPAWDHEVEAKVIDGNSDG